MGAAVALQSHRMRRRVALVACSLLQLGHLPSGTEAAGSTAASWRRLRTCPPYEMKNDPLCKQSACLTHCGCTWLNMGCPKATVNVKLGNACIHWRPTGVNPQLGMREKHCSNRRKKTAITEAYAKKSCPKEFAACLAGPTCQAQLIAEASKPGSNLNIGVAMQKLVKCVQVHRNTWITNPQQHSKQTGSAKPRRGDGSGGGGGGGGGKGEGHSTHAHKHRIDLVKVSASIEFAASVIHSIGPINRPRGPGNHCDDDCQTILHHHQQFRKNFRHAVAAQLGERH